MESRRRDTRKRDSILAGRGYEIELSCECGGARRQDWTRSGDDNARFQASWNRAFIFACITRVPAGAGTTLSWQSSHERHSFNRVEATIGRRLPGNHVVEEARVWPGGSSI